MKVYLVVQRSDDGGGYVEAVRSTFEGAVDAMIMLGDDVCQLRRQEPVAHDLDLATETAKYCYSPIDRFVVFPMTVDESIKTMYEAKARSPASFDR